MKKTFDLSGIETAVTVVIPHIQIVTDVAGTAEGNFAFSLILTSGMQIGSTYIDKETAQKERATLILAIESYFSGLERR